MVTELEKIDRSMSSAISLSKKTPFRTLVEQAPEMVAVVQADGTIAYINAAVQHVLGYKPEERVGMSALEHVHPEDRHRLSQTLEQLLKTPENIATLECRFQHKDGSWRALESVGRYMQNEQCDECVAVYTRDITKRKQYEEDLKLARSTAEEMNLIKTAFLENVSHELRTPLTGILGSASVLSEEVPHPQRDLVGLITKSGERLLETVNALLDLALLEAGTLKLNLETINIVQATREKVAALRYAAQENGLALTFDATALALWAQLDRARLNRILESLVGNAIKFSEKGHIRVSVVQDTSRVYIRVQDEGIGISKPFLQKMFDAFYQESTGDARLYEGMGLGLTITQHLAQKMGGAIVVKSEKGEGSTFIVSFPQAPVDTRQSSRVPLPHLSGPQRVLVVDDDPDTRRLIEYMLADATHLETVGTAAQALEKARRHQYDVVLLDIDLGREWGTNVLVDLRALPGYDTVPIVALTVYASLHHRRRFLQAGFDDHLGKPFSKENLLRILGLSEANIR